MYEWDEDKRKANVKKHGVDFAAMERFDWTSAVFGAPQVVDNEMRESAIGFIDTDLYMAVYTDRGDATRIITLRRANRKERKAYDEA